VETGNISGYKKGFYVLKGVVDPYPAGSASFWRIRIGMAQSKNI
jgi:hypothetical protein